MGAGGSVARRWVLLALFAAVAAIASAACAPAATTPTITDSPASVPSGVWQPAPGTSWQWQITGKVDPSLPVAMYDIDLFDAQPAASSYTVARVRLGERAQG